MKIVDVEIIPIRPRLAERYDHRRFDLRQIDCRNVFRVTTDNGIVGYGDTRTRRDPPPRSSVEHFIDRDPFEFINSTEGDLNGAIYDVLGKHLEQPAYRLMGEKVRDRVKVAAWTRPASPDDFAKEIQRSVDQGYMTFKMHSCKYFDVLEQTRAAEEVAPEGFKIHWDFNGDSGGPRTIGGVLQLIKHIEENHPIVGFIEDALTRSDLESWCQLREKMNVPLVMHVPPLGGIHEVVHGAADIYMIGSGHGGLRRGFAYAALNIPTIMQAEAGTIGKAFALHTAAVLPTMTQHAINLDDQYEEDYATTEIPVVDGFSPVPEGPGLGIEVDEEALRRMAGQQEQEIPRVVGILRMPGGSVYHGPEYVDPDGEEGTVRGMQSELWTADGTEKFAAAYRRVQAEGVVQVA